MEGVIFSLTEAVVRSLLCKLGCLLSQESWLLQSVHGDMQYIKDELESMNAFLRTLTTSEGHDDQVRIWMKRGRLPMMLRTALMSSYTTLVTHQDWAYVVG